MAEEWQVEAVKEQFKVLNSLETLLKDLNIDDVCEVKNEVNNVVNTHLRVNQDINVKPIRHICAEIIRASETTTNVKFGFIVIVTDQRVNGLLSKIPIFVIKFENKTVFIDMSCFLFKSWDMFLKHCEKVLPPGKFCFPVNGHYLDGRRLKVDFNQTISIQKNCWLPLLGFAIGVGAIVMTWFFNIKPEFFDTVKSLLPLAEQFLEGFDCVFSNVLCDMLRNFSQWRTGKMNYLTLAVIIFKLLSKLQKEYKKEIDAMVVKIKDTFWSVWDFLKKEFSFFFNSESRQSSPPLRLLATVHSNDESFMRNDVRQNDMGAAQQVFENCVRESALHYDVKKTSQDEPITLTPNNKALVCMTSNFVQHNYSYFDQHKLPQNELSYIYLSLKDLVDYESRERLKLYHKHKDAVLKTGCEMDFDEYNKCLGVEGDPTAHCFMEAISHINNSPIMKLLVKNKCKELVEQEPVQLIQCLEMPNNKKLGLYKSIGMEKGLIPAKKFVSALKGIFCTDNDADLFDENKLVVKEENKELSSEIVLFINRLHIFIWQSLNKENYAEGFLAVFEDN